MGRSWKSSRRSASRWRSIASALPITRRRSSALLGLPARWGSSCASCCRPKGYGTEEDDHRAAHDPQGAAPGLRHREPDSGLDPARAHHRCLAPPQGRLSPQRPLNLSSVSDAADREAFQSAIRAPEDQVAVADLARGSVSRCAPHAAGCAGRQRSRSSWCPCRHRVDRSRPR